MSDPMHPGPHPTGVPRLFGPARMLLATTTLVLGGLLISGLTGDRPPRPAFAASPVAIPAAVCAVSGTGSTPSAASPSVTPGIPVAAEGEVPAQIIAAVANLVACWRDTAWETSVALVTDRYLESNLGTVDRTVAVASLQRLSSAGLVGAVQVDTVGDIRTQGIGFASAEVVWRQGKALRHDRWRFVAAQGRWLLNEIEYLVPDATGDAVGIEAIVEGDRLQLSRGRVVDPGIVVIHIRSLRTDATSLSVFRSATTAQLRDWLGGVLPPTGESPFIGELIVPALEEADLVLIDLAPDTYTIVAGLRGQGGVLEVRDTMSATLAVADP